MFALEKSLPPYRFKGSVGGIEAGDWRVERDSLTENTQDIISRHRKLLFNLVTGTAYRFLNHREHKRRGGVHCDYDSGDGCQLEISTFTFIFTQLRTELRFYLFICLLVFNVGKGSWLSAHTASSWWTLLKFSQGSPGFPSLLVTTSRDKCPKGR